MNTKIRPITVRFTWNERERIEKSAAESNLNLSDYIRKHLPETKGNK